MPRPRADGTAARPANRRKLTDLFVQSSPKVTVPEMVWDTKAPGLALSIRPTGKKAWRVVYPFGGRPRWYTLGDARVIGLADARRLASSLSPKAKIPQPSGGPSAAPAPSAIWRPNTSSCGPRSTINHGSRPRPWWRAFCCHAGAR